MACNNDNKNNNDDDEDDEDEEENALGKKQGKIRAKCDNLIISILFHSFLLLITLSFHFQ